MNSNDYSTRNEYLFFPIFFGILTVGLSLVFLNQAVVIIPIGFMVISLSFIYYLHINTLFDSILLTTGVFGIITVSLSLIFTPQASIILSIGMSLCILTMIYYDYKNSTHNGLFFAFLTILVMIIGTILVILAVFGQSSASIGSLLIGILFLIMVDIKAFDKKTETHF